MRARFRAGGNFGESFQIERQITGGLETLGWMLFQTMTHDSVEAWRNIACGFGELRRLFFQNRAHDVGRGLAVEGALARDHFVEDRAKGKNIGAMIGRLAANLFGRHVSGRAHDYAGFGSDLNGGRVTATVLGFRAR